MLVRVLGLVLVLVRVLVRVLVLALVRVLVLVRVIATMISNIRNGVTSTSTFVVCARLRSRAILAQVSQNNSRGRWRGQTGSDGAVSKNDKALADLAARAVRSHASERTASVLDMVRIRGRSADKCYCWTRCPLRLLPLD